MRYSRFGFVAMLLLLSVSFLLAEEANDKTVFAEFCTNEYITLFHFAKAEPEPFELAPEIFARAPRPCKKPFKLACGVQYHLSIDRKPLDGLDPLLRTLSPFNLGGISFHYPVAGNDLELLSSVPGLIRLELEHQVVDEACFNAIGKLKALKELSFDSCEFQLCEGLKQLVEIPNLEVLHLINSTNLKCVAEQIPEIKKLKTLTLKGGEVTNEVLAYAAQVKFWNLNVSSDIITDEAISQLRFMGELRNLSIGGSRLTSKCIENIKKMAFIKNLRIEGLSLCNADWKSPKKIYLTRLAIINTDLDDYGFASILENFSISQLILVNNPQLFRVKFRGARSMLRFPEEVYIDIPTCDEECRLWLSTKCLKKLRLSKENILFNDVPLFPPVVTSVRYSGIMHPECLRKLMLSENWLSTLELSQPGFERVYEDEALLYISKQTSLDKIRVDGIRSENFSWISSLVGLRLRYLSLNNVNSICDKTLGKFTEFKHLTQLDLRGKPNITATGIKKLENMEHLVCFNPTPLELIEEHEYAVIQLLNDLANFTGAEKLDGAGYFRSGISAFPQLSLDTRDSKYGYSYKYFSNSNSDDATRYVFIAVPDDLEDGTRAFVRTEQGTYVSGELSQEDIALLEELDESRIDFDKDSAARVDRVAFEKLN